MTEQIMGFLIAFIMGAIGLAIGLSYKFGYSRQSYIIHSPWNNGIKYASIPSGVFFMTLSIFAFIDINSISIFVEIFIVIILPIIALWFNFFPPKFLYPEWYRWIQNNHADIWPVLREEAAKDYYAWYRKTRTQEGLEQWVEEVRQKL